MTAIFSELLPLESGWRVVGVAVDRIRLGSGRGIVQYGVDVTRNGESQRLLVAGVTYDGDKAARVATTPLPPGGHVGPVTGLTAFWPETNMAFLIFPFDPGLPGLSRLAERMPSAVADESESVEPVRHRLGIAATVAVTGKQRRYVKFHPPGGAEVSWRRGESFTAMLPASIVTAPTSLLPELEATVSPALGGVPMEASDVDHVAGVLAGLHESPADGLRPASVPSVERALRFLGVMAPDLADRAHRKLVQLEPPRSRGAAVHGDLKPEHVLISGDAVTLLDLDSSGSGRALADIAALSVRLADEQGGALYEAYRRSAPQRSWDEWAAEWTLAAIEYAQFHARRRRPGWRRAAAEVIDRPAPV